jgi:acetyl esterase/lipase
MKRSLIAVALLASSVVVSGQSSPPPPLDASLQPSLEGATDIVYKRASGVELKLWVFSPADLKTSDTRPAILLFGGGGWTNQNPAQFSPVARYFATKGLIAILADYRVRNANQTTPYESVTDAKSAVRWLREHASELHIAPTMLAVGGGSAGGHIALAAAVLSELDEPSENQAVSSKPNALVLFNPVPNTVADPQAVLSPQQQGFVALLGARAREISPIHHLGKNLPPTIIFHGKADTLVPFSEAEAFCRRAVELGNRCELVAFEGADHGFFNPTRNGAKWYYDTLSAAETFLRSLGYVR